MPNRISLKLTQLEHRDTPATLPTDFAETAIATGLTNPTAMAVAPNGDVWVLEQAGTVKRFPVGSTAADVVTSVTVDSAGERGLLGIAFDPNYAANKLVYLYHTVPAAGATAAFNRVSRVVVNDANPADYTAGSPQPILSLDPLSAATNHNGGAIHFGPDGKLYVGVGENATPANAQSLANRLGKILRINPDGTIPTDNPTAFDGISGTTTGANRSVWAVGLRNPFTFAFQPGTGRLFLNDVGQSAFEEIDEGRAGANYGWPQTEGFTPAGAAGVTYPVYAYAHGTGPLQGFSIAGGAFYNPTTKQFPAAYTGDYFFADFVAGRIYVRDAATGTVTTFAEAAGQPVDLGVTADGRFLYLSRQAGQVFAVRSTLSPVTAGRPVAAATGPGVPVQVKVRNADGSTRFTLTPFGGFAGGASVAVGDLTGDGAVDVVVAAGPGGGPHVKVFDGLTGFEVRSFFAFGAGFAGGVSVAVADTDGNGTNEIVVGAGAGGGPHVKVFDRAGNELRGFFAFAAGFAGGVTVAAGDTDGDGKAEVVVGAGAGGGPNVKVFRGVELTEVRSFFAYAPGFVGGVFVAAGDLDGDGKAEVVTGTGAGGGPHVKVFSGDTGAEAGGFFAYPPGFAGGVRVAVAGGRIVTGAGPGGAPHLRLFDPAFQPVGDDFPFDTAFRGGLFVG